MTRKISWFLLGLLPILTVVGARYQVPGLLLVMNCLIGFYVILAGFGKIFSSRQLPLLLFFIGLGLLWQTSIQTNNLVGTDIHTEYYYYKLAESSWDTTLRHTYNSALGLVVVAPFINKVFMLDGMWTFKFLYPALFALTPVVLYFVYKTFLSEKRAFLAACFFVFFPSFMLEIVSITKFQLAGLMFSLVLLIGVKSNWSWKLRLPLGILCGLLCAGFYYSFGYLIFMYILAAIGVLGVMKLWPWIRGKVTLPYKGLLIAGLGIILTSCIYFGTVCQGDPLRTLTFYAGQNILTFNPSESRYAELIKIKREELEKSIGTSGNISSAEQYLIEKVKNMESEPQWTQIGLTELGILPGRDAPPDTKNYLMRAAFGLDFLKVGLSGKLFRLLTLFTEFSIVLGAWVLFRKRKEIPNIIISAAIASCSVLFLCVFKPGFSGLLNITRVYQICLFSLAPLGILGGTWIFERVKYPKDFGVKVFSCVLVMYFIFSSGIVFELEKRPSIDTQDIPYSIALSSYRIDIAGLFTESDAEVSQWVKENLPLDEFCFADLPGMELMYQWTHDRVFHFPQNWIPQSLELIPNKSWVFLREWNEENQMVTHWTNTGLRSSMTYKDRGLDTFLVGREVIYRRGNSVVYGDKK